jgi:esterase/lipase superfamily enzyme
MKLIGIRTTQDAHMRFMTNGPIAALDWRWLASLATTLLLGACASTHPLMPSPVLYTGFEARPLFGDLPAESEAPPLDLLYITDRTRGDGHNEAEPYTSGRSRAMAFGSTTVEFGKDVPWKALAEMSTMARRPTAVDLTLGPTTEIGRFPRIPYDVAVTPAGVQRSPAILAAHEQARVQLQQEIQRRLALANRKEVVLFVHGYNNTFEDAALTMGEMCHFLGREFVCAIFTWPAGGRRGILFGYNEDRESSEFGVEHLVKAIRIIADTPGVERIHLIAHSRGTDVLATALSELSAEAYGLRTELAEHFHIGNVVLVAPDLDSDVAPSKIYRIFSDPDQPFGDRPNPAAVLPPSPDFKVTVYVSPDDKALATSGWLFGSIARLGRLTPEMLTPHDIEQAQTLGLFDVVQVVGSTDLFGHDYFVSNPYVSADIIAMLRYGLKPNEPGRPLEEVQRPFWRIARDSSH